MTPPPPPPPPAPGVAGQPPPPPPSGPIADGPAVSVAPKMPTAHPGGATVADHNDQLMSAIRNGISLKPTKTNDRSTAGFIKRANGPLNVNGTPDQSPDDPTSPDKGCATIDEMKDALQAELRNTLKRKIKQQHPHDDEGADCRRNDEIERAIEQTRNEVQLKLNGPSPGPAEGAAPKVDNPLKMLVELVDKERTASVTTVKQPSPLLGTAPKTTAAQGAAAPPTVQSQPNGVNGTATLKKVSIGGQGPRENGNGTRINVSPTPWKSSAPSSPIVRVSAAKSAATHSPASNAATNGTPVPIVSKSPSPGTVAASNGPIFKSPFATGKVANGAAPAAAAAAAVAVTTSPSVSPPPVAMSAASNANTSQTGKGTSPVANGSVVRAAALPPTNGTAAKVGPTSTVKIQAPKTGGAFLGSASSSPAAPTKGGSYYNTLPRAYGVRVAASSAATGTPKTAAAPPPGNGVPGVYNSTVKISIGSYGDSAPAATQPPTKANGLGPIVRNGVPPKIEPLTIDVSGSNGGGSSTNGTASPSTPKELLSPQVRSGTASIRPSQIRTLTKAGSVVSHTDIVETPRAIVKVPVSLIEPAAPVLTAAAAASPPPPMSAPSSPRRVGSAAAVTSPGARFEKRPSASKDAPKSPLNRWADSTSISGGTARKLLLSHGRPNFTIKRSNSRQGFDVDVPDSRNDTVKPVFRILTDLERMETEQEDRQQPQQHPREQASSRRPSATAVVNGGGQQPPVQQQYVSFARDLSNAPNNHPDVAVVTRTVPSEPATDPFLATLKDIKIDIGEMKVVPVNAKDH